MPFDFAAVFNAVVIAAVYSFLHYLSKHPTGFQKENFKPFKFGATILVGVGVGVSFALAGSPLSQESIEAQLVAYSGTVVFVERVLKLLVRTFRKRRKTKG